MTGTDNENRVNVENSETNQTMDDLLKHDLLMPNLKKGDVVIGKISGINESHIIVSLGAKQDGYAEIGDYLENGKLPFEVGDDIKGFIVKMNDDQIVISKSLNQSHGNKVLIREAFEKQIPVKGKVLEIKKGGFQVDVFGIKAFCPLTHIDVNFNEKPESYINGVYDFEILELSRGSTVISRKNLLAREHSEKKEQFFSNIKVGDIRTGKVSRITKFGAFIELGGFDGLLHISEMSWYHIDKAEDSVHSGDEIQVKVIAIEGDKISLSMRALIDNPLIDAISRYKVGDEVKCKVLRHESFGSFVEIEKGVEGLIPISLMNSGKRRARPADILTIGDEVSATIVKLDPQHLKISLSLSANTNSSWETDIADLTENQELMGIIENVTEHGIFIKIRENVTGLMPNSKVKKARLDYKNEDIGKEIEVRISRIDVDSHKLSLEPTSLPILENPPERRSEGRSQNSENRSRRRPDRDNDKERGESRRGKPSESRRQHSESRADTDRSNDSDWDRYATNYQSVPDDNPFNNLKF